MTTDSIHALSDRDGRAAFATHLKPYVARLLSSIGLDVVYHRGEGDYLFYRDEEGQEHRVLDLLGGYGAAFFGHNHPELLQRAADVLEARRPFVAQASSRAYAGLLAQRLAGSFKQATGHEFVVTLANSGTEAAEAAIKHAEMEAARKMEAILGHLRRVFRAIRVGLRSGDVTVAPDLFKAAENNLKVPEIENLEELEHRLLQHNQQVCMGENYLLAMAGAFHGKTTGSLKLTHNPEFRGPWERIGINVHFLPRNDEPALEREIEQARTYCFHLEITPDRQVRLVKLPWSKITACFVEPILGEGGIQELSPSYLQALRAAADEEGFPLVIDEIQSGMGRTGRFLASEEAGVAGDYYLLSKALGGGLAKIAALLVRRERYQEDFGYIHSSTFADDDFSSAIALGALDLLERNDGELMRAARQKGDLLLKLLRQLQNRFPRVIKDVRGRGLMIGIELGRLAGQATPPLLRVLSDQNLLGFLLCGYLLHQADIRIAPTLSDHSTIRIEPSAYLAQPDLERFAQSLEQAVAALDAGNTAAFVQFLVCREKVDGAPVPCEPVASATKISTTPAGATGAAGMPRVAFLGHFIEPNDLLHWDPTLGALSAGQCTRLLDCTSELIEPFIAQETVVGSSSGESVAVSIIGLPFTSEQIANRMRTNTLEPVLEKIGQAVEQAKHS